VPQGARPFFIQKDSPMENATILPFEPKPERSKLQCTSCLATTDAPCECGAPFRILKPRERARVVLEQNPNLSNRAAAELAQTSATTVRQVRENAQLVGEERIGLNGKRYPEPIWNDERDAEMERLLREGYSYADVGVQMGTTAGAISGRWARIQDKKLRPVARGLPEIMPDDVLAQADEYFRRINIPMHDLESLTMYADQMHEDAKHAIAEYLKIIGDLSKSGIKRLIGDPRDIKPPQCGVRIRIRKDEE
jgi:hypothetical protein